jgi:hypothetical protein
MDTERLLDAQRHFWGQAALPSTRSGQDPPAHAEKRRAAGHRQGAARSGSHADELAGMARRHADLGDRFAHQW